MNFKPVQHLIHDATKILPEDNRDVLVYFKLSYNEFTIGHRGHYTEKDKHWRVADECDHWNGENYRKLDRFETVVAWSELPRLDIVPD